MVQPGFTAAGGKRRTGLQFEYHAAVSGFKVGQGDAAATTGWIVQISLACGKTLEHQKVLTAPEQDAGKASVLLQMPGCGA